MPTSRPGRIAVLLQGLEHADRHRAVGDQQGVRRFRLVEQVQRGSVGARSLVLRTPDQLRRTAQPRRLQRIPIPREPVVRSTDSDGPVMQPIR